MNCGFCNSKIIKILDLGKTPLANSFLSKTELKNKEKKYKLTLSYCLNCYLFQAPRDAKPNKIFNEKYVYFSSTSKYWTEHAKKFCIKIVKKINLKSLINMTMVGYKKYKIKLKKKISKY